jgi:hypothetical protein
MATTNASYVTVILMTAARAKCVKPIDRKRLDKFEKERGDEHYSDR